MKRREVELDPQQSPGEIKSREVELGSQNAGQSFASVVSQQLLFVTLFGTAFETAISEVHKLLGTGGGPTSLTLLFWRWLAVSSVFAGRSARTSYKLPAPFPRPQ